MKNLDILETAAKTGQGVFVTHKQKNLEFRKEKVKCILQIHRECIQDF